MLLVLTNTFTMKKRILLYTFLSILCCTVYAQKIDFNMTGRNEAEGTEPDYTPWAISQTTSASLTVDGITFTLSCSGETTTTLCTKYYKAAVVNQGAKLVGDAAIVYGLADDGGIIHCPEKSMTINVKLSGLSAGEHSILAYHNDIDGKGSSAPIEIAVNGETVLSGVEQTSRETLPSNSGQSYIKFTVANGEDVTISYTSKPVAGETYGTSCVYINAIILDQSNPKTTALDPFPQNRDIHVDADNGTLELSWTMASSAVKNHLYIGTSIDDMQKIASVTDNKYTLTDVYSMNTYFWRVDEEDTDGNVYTGEIWQFRARQLAFPGAEGYGRYATGGRGGIVYHVTSLDDDASNPQPGTFRYGISKLSGPRTIVFDVSGVITLQSRLTVHDPYVTIAGQTAPGTGIMLKGRPFGMANEGITRFIRLRLGGADDWDGVSGNPNTADGLGMAGNNHSIMDHCSVGWTIDEAFSSRNAKNITLQRTLISESLNYAGHNTQFIQQGHHVEHGYAATIGGDYGSYHHNLLAHNQGRNWSMSGGLSDGNYAGHHDMFNNVCYNWGGRATDGGTHQGQFVNNYYKMGPATTLTYLITADIEGTGGGTQAYYVNGNIRENKNGTLTTDAKNEPYRYRLSNGQVLDWTVFVDKPFFPSYATIEPAKLAFKTVLSDVGCNQPFFDNHDTRMVEETLKGTYTYKGWKTGKPGLIDKESDSEGFDGLNIVEEHRPADYDTDQDGMPDWWEIAKGLDPNIANNNDDNDRDGYTDLEDYLNWLAEPHYMIPANSTTEIDLNKLFAGFDNAPYYNVSTTDNITATVSGSTLKIAPAQNIKGFYTLQVTASDNDNAGTMTRNINLYADTEISAIGATTTEEGEKSYQIYSINGILMKNSNDFTHLAPGIYIVKEICNTGSRSYKVIHEI